MNDSDENNIHSGEIHKYKQSADENQEARSKPATSSSDTGLQMTLDDVLDPGLLFDAGYNDMPLEELVQLGNEVSTTKPIRVVTNWSWFDIRTNKNVFDRYADAGLQPVMLMANEILYDSTDPDAVGNWVRTSLLQKFHPPGIFETRNRVYVMVNSGRRKSVTPEFINSIF
ncbi:MAG: DUF6957 family protein [Neptuniibacter sp.]